MITLNQTDLEAHGELYRLHSNLRYSCNPRVTFREGRGMRDQEGSVVYEAGVVLPLTSNYSRAFLYENVQTRRRQVQRA